MRSAYQMRVSLALVQSGISNFALVRNKIKKKNALYLNQSAFSNFASCVISTKTIDKLKRPDKLNFALIKVMDGQLLDFEPTLNVQSLHF